MLKNEHRLGLENHPIHHSLIPQKSQKLNKIKTPGG